jgi:hypothetical protein
LLAKRKMLKLNILNTRSYLSLATEIIEFDSTKSISNISSFASLSNDMEIAQGLSRLSSDIDNNHFRQVKKSFDEKTGDYLIIEFSKD